MSKAQRDKDVSFLRDLAAKQPCTYRAAITHAADALEASPLDGFSRPDQSKPTAKKPPEDKGDS